MELSHRLETLLSLVTPGKTAADIGTDHGYIPIELVRRGICRRAIGVDVREGPLARARSHVERQGLGGQVSLRLGDGLAPVSPGEADRILIAGMGGPLMRKILAEAPETAHAAEELILSPQSEAGAFRRFLRENGYRIAEEALVEEEGKYYPVLRVIPSEVREEIPAAECDLYGNPAVLRPQDLPVRQAFLEKEWEVWTEVRRHLEGQRSETAKARLVEVEERIERILRARQADGTGPVGAEEKTGGSL